MKFTFTLLLFLLLYQPFKAQTPISGQINAYAAVQDIDYCTAGLSMNATNGFQVGQAVLLIQMQGAAIDESNSSSFGSISNINQAGLHERGVIAQISGNTIFLEKLLVNTYSVAGKVQLVSIPVYADAIVVSPLDAKPWDGSTGGIVALEVLDSLILTAPIRADGAGFRGGIKNILPSNCQWFLDEDDFFYGLNNWRGANKGEGIAAFIAGKEAGRGAQANGGGGGNDHNTGGGGGGHATAGGQGGEQTPPSVFGCGGDYPGRGGKQISQVTNRLFMGGGGGAGHVDNSNAGGNGGNGGGIVYVLAGKLIGNNQTLSANGQDAPTADGDGGGGGGGAGTVILQASQVLSPCNLHAKGGNGGNTMNIPDRCFGPGGGGSGGRLLLGASGISNINLNGGTSGIVMPLNATCNGSNNGALAGSTGLQQAFSNLPQGALDAQPLAIVVQPPMFAQGCENNPTFLSVGVLGLNVSYQWQVNTGSGFQNISNGPVYSGTASADLIILNTQTSMEGYQYRCIVSNACFGPITSQASTLQVSLFPEASFSFDANFNQVSFLNGSLHADTYSWDFGDGTPPLLAVDPTHTYAEDGVYTVTLSAANACGTDEFSLTLTIVTLPTAGLEASPLQGCLPLEVAFSSLASPNTTSWQWFFPGGQPAASTQPNPVVVYDNPGVFDATLIASNSAGSDTLVFPELITVSGPPEAGFDFSIAGLVVSFSNTSLDADAYSWTFGDGGVSDLPDPEYTYPDFGAYIVELEATNACGTAVFADTVLLGAPPKSDFMADFTGGCVPFTVQFSDLSTGTITNWSWSFPGGNPASSSDQNPQVVYETPGIYPVSLTASGPLGMDELSLTDFIEAVDFPEPDFTFTISGDTAFFTNTTPGTGLSFSWDFGDGSAPSAAVDPFHIFPADSVYVVTLSASNLYCGSGITYPVNMGEMSVFSRLAPSVARLFPNPATEQVFVEISRPLAEGGQLIIWDALGRERWQQALAGSPAAIDVASWPAGFYWVEIRWKNAVWQGRLIKS